MASLGEAIVKAATIDDAIKILDRMEILNDVEDIYRRLDSLKRYKGVKLSQAQLDLMLEIVSRWREELYNGA